MKPLNYIISTNGLGIAIGIVGNKELALQDATCAENIFSWNHSDELFDHLLHAPSVKAFQRFLVMKEYYAVWDEHWSKNKVAGRRDPALVFTFTKRAIRRARLTMESSVTYSNFMSQISCRNQEFAMGGYSDEPAAE